MQAAFLHCVNATSAESPHHGSGSLSTAKAGNEEMGEDDEEETAADLFQKVETATAGVDSKDVAPLKLKFELARGNWKALETQKHVGHDLESKYINSFENWNGDMLLEQFISTLPANIESFVSVSINVCEISNFADFTFQVSPQRNHAGKCW
jgi:hypothetical protein